LFCSSPLNFNDPFDCVVRIDYSFPSDNDIIKKLYQIEKHIHPKWEDSKILEIVKSQFDNFDKNTLQNKELMKSSILNHIHNYIGIYLLSGEQKNILLWSHYSASHKGFLVEFNALNLKIFLVNTYLSLNQKHLLLEVKYSNTYKLINAYSDEYDKELMKAFLTKSTVWSYEKE